ncbi:MAG: transglutaminase-like domain-containing protein, partial [Bacilli bacterium]|nr:transglutaminase-like domain-containing protein [Bacilli bacterium]
AYMKPLKFMFEYDKNVITIDRMNIKTNKEEISKVDAFLDVFLKEFDGKSDYEKIMGVYTYLNNTAIYQNDDGYINFLDGQLSAYDVLIKHKAVCIGLATTFQLLMERLGIESYIVDHVSSKSDTEYITTHTYNVVKLNNEWYIVDIPLDGSLNGLLKGMSDSYSLEDFKYYDIKIADSSYLDTHKEESKDFSFDYASLLDLIEKIESNKKEDSTIANSNGKKSYVMEYVLIAIILIVIFGVIFIFTRKK